MQNPTSAISTLAIPHHLDEQDPSLWVADGTVLQYVGLAQPPAPRECPDSGMLQHTSNSGFNVHNGVATSLFFDRLSHQSSKSTSFSGTRTAKSTAYS